MDDDGTGAGRPVEHEPAAIGVRELSRNLSRVIAEVTASGVPVIVTRRGVPIAAVVPIPAAEPAAAGPDDGPEVKAP